MVLLTSCKGTLSDVYDEPPAEKIHTAAGQLYIDASDWGYWHFLDLKTLADKVNADPDFNTSSEWESIAIPTAETATEDTAGKNGIYTYWYDIFGEGTSHHKYRSFYPTAPQPEPDEWSIAVHRNNLRTNGGSIAATGLHDIDGIPLSTDYISSLNFTDDSWNETDVWVTQDKMLSGLIGNQGITINHVGSSWLRIDIPPMPPAFTLDDNVFIIRLNDGTYGALQLVDYQSPLGTKCCLTINYRYPLSVQ